ncbi:MAG: YihY/virulence factor BrkB family protein [Clostridia bacterium]|nr:YihY/virulence factor BrkB family protein [Clostridia bacterium]
MKKYAKSLLSFLKTKRITTVAGAWVYYFLTALLPILFLALTAFSVFGVNLSEAIVLRLPVEFSKVGEALFSTASNASGGITVFFFVAVLYSGSTLLNQMLKDGEHIYEHKKSYKYGFLRRVISLLAIGVLFIVFMACAIFSAFQNVILSGFNANDSKFKIILVVFSVIIVSYFLINLLNKFICPVKRKFYSFLLGSLVSLFIIVLGTIAFMVWLRLLKPYNAFYGSLAGVIAFLFWTYIVMLGLVIGVCFNVKTFNKKSKR